MPSLLFFRIEESDAKLKYLQDLHEAYENWLINSNSTKNMYSIKVIDANQSQEQMWEEMSFKNDPISRLKQLSEK
mgnify:FL=1